MAANATILGVSRIRLVANVDERGSLIEIFRKSWNEEAEPTQWNLLLSRPRVLRGMKMHVVHTDILVLVSGRCTVALRDFRHESPTFRATDFFELDAASEACVLPPGVAHTFYFHDESALLVGVSRYWDKEDELGCRWDDPALGLHWPDGAPIVSPDDLLLPSVEVLEARTATHRFMH